MTILVDRGPPGPLQHVYVHVPFCTDRCTYCAFATLPDAPARHEALVVAIEREASRAEPPAPLRSVYLGGGTPGLLAPQHLARLVRAAVGDAGLDRDAEVTLEVNPADVSDAALAAWHALGVTRLSVGVQTLRDDVLARLGRHHDGSGARAALDRIATRWPGTWSLDLLVGWAAQTLEDVRRDLTGVLAYAPPHVSVYGLTLEPDTPLHQLAARGVAVAIDARAAPRFDALWSERLAAAGLERYEVSNFARPGHRSRHNQAYWSNQDYLGLGPSAASSRHPHRWTNEPDLLVYVQALESGHDARAHAETLTPTQRVIESLAVGLRTRDGLPLDELDRRFSPAWRDALAAPLGAATAAGFLVDPARGALRVAPGHLVRADSLAAALTCNMDV